jgi:hypothetical protein
MSELVEELMYRSALLLATTSVALGLLGSVASPGLMG